MLRLLRRVARRLLRPFRDQARADTRAQLAGIGSGLSRTLPARRRHRNRGAAPTAGGAAGRTRSLRGPHERRWVAATLSRARDLPLVEPDIIDDGEKLTTLAPQSQDFVIASHFLEHCQDPIGTLKAIFRVIKPGGMLYLALPDKRYTFDRERPVTPLDHLWTDHRTGPGAFPSRSR